MPRVKACHGIPCDNTSQSSRFCFNQPEVAGFGSRLGPNMFAVPLKPALGTVNLHDHPDSPEATTGLHAATEVVEVDSQRSDVLPEETVARFTGTASSECRTETVEARAKLILETFGGPSKAQLLDLFNALPRSLFRRADGGDGGSSISFVVGGVNPRSSTLPLHLCNSHPNFVRAVTSYVREVCPSHKFSTFVIRRGLSGKVHRDCKNGPCPSVVVGLNDCLAGDRLWIHDKVGSCTKRHLDQDLLGTVVPLRAPFVFDARKTLHAGHLSDVSLAPSRVVLVAFTTINARYTEPRVKVQMEELGFPLPDAEDMHMQDGVVLKECPKRLRQLTFLEALHLTREEDEAHDVIEVLDSQD